MKKTPPSLYPGMEIHYPKSVIPGLAWILRVTAVCNAVLRAKIVHVDPAAPGSNPAGTKKTTSTVLIDPKAGLTFTLPIRSGGGTVVFRGEWSATETYAMDNVVVIGGTYDAGTYISLVDGNNENPANSSKWYQWSNNSGATGFWR